MIFAASVLIRSKIRHARNDCLIELNLTWNLFLFEEKNLSLRRPRRCHWRNCRGHYRRGSRHKSIGYIHLQLLPFCFSLENPSRIICTNRD